MSDEHKTTTKSNMFEVPMGDVKYYGYMYKGSTNVKTHSIEECTLLGIDVRGPRDFFTNLGQLGAPIYMYDLWKEFNGKSLLYFKDKFLTKYGVCAADDPIWHWEFDNFSVICADIDVFSNLQILRIWCKRVDTPKKLYLTTVCNDNKSHSDILDALRYAELAHHGVKAYSGRNPYGKDSKETTFFGRTYMTEDLRKYARTLEVAMGEKYGWNRIPGIMYVKEKKVPEQEMHETRAEWKLKDLGVKKVIFNGPATIVLFNDGTKSVVKCSEHDNMSKEAGIALALLKHGVGDEYFHYILKHLLKDAEGDV